jgi:hypothetical protein
MFCTVMESFKCRRTLVPKDFLESPLQVIYCKLYSVQVRSIFTFLRNVTEITNGEPCQNAVFWRAAECHCQEAEFLLHIFKNKFKASNAFFNSAIKLIS